MKQNKSFCNDFQMSFCQGWLDISFKLKQKAQVLMEHISVPILALIVRSPNTLFSSLERTSEEVLLLDVISH